MHDIKKSLAQNIPLFTPKNITLHIPAFIPGLMEDPIASLRNDTLIYTLNGQLFERGILMKPEKSSMRLSNPFATIYEMKDAYLNRNSRKIINLYTFDSKSRIESILYGPHANEFLNYLSQSALSLKIMGVINYKDGFVVYTKDDKNTLHENFVKKEKGVYKLSALDDSSSTSWNIGLYLKFEPKPIMHLENVDVPDSLRESDSATVIVSLPEAGRWVAFYNEPLGQIMFIAQDNGVNDFDSIPGKITIHFKGSMFLNPGSYTYYISSFNFPIQRGSRNFIKKEAGYSIKII